MTTSYAERFNGNLQGMLHWPQLDALWAAMRTAPEGWYLVERDAPLPQQPLPAAEFLRRLQAVDALLRDEHRQSYCGIVYADDAEAPELVKVFDPRSLGTMCGGHAEPTPPQWVFSRLPPQPLPAPVRAAARRPWWRAWLAGQRP